MKPLVTRAAGLSHRLPAISRNPQLPLELTERGIRQLQITARCLVRELQTNLRGLEWLAKYTLSSAAGDGTFPARESTFPLRPPGAPLQ